MKSEGIYDPSSQSRVVKAKRIVRAQSAVDHQQRFALTSEKSKLHSARWGQHLPKTAN